MKLVIIDYGAGNIKSIQFAFKRLGVQAVLSHNIDEIKAADRIIFPGVGEASSAMNMLTASGLAPLIPTLKQPVLGICLGMQLMCNFSEEGNTKGLGIFNVDVKRFSKTVKVPQMGWNLISDLKSPLFKGIKDQEFMYLVHSFYAEQCAEVPRMLKAIKTAQIMYMQDYDVYVRCAAYPPKASTEPQHWDHQNSGGFKVIDFRPSSEVRGSYMVSTTSYNFTAVGIIDVDGDGVYATYVATKTENPNNPITPSDVY